MPCYNNSQDKYCDASAKEDLPFVLNNEIPSIVYNEKADELSRDIIFDLQNGTYDVSRNKPSDLCDEMFQDQNNGTTESHFTELDNNEISSTSSNNKSRRKKKSLNKDNIHFVLGHK